MISVFSVECKRNKWDSYRLSAIRLLLTADTVILSAAKNPGT